MTQHGLVPRGGGYGGGPSRIVRALLVVEFEHAPHLPTSALLVHQTGGQADLAYEDDHTWDRFGHQIPLGRPRKHNVNLSGYGDVQWWDNADDLFAQWSGQQPTSNDPQPPAIGPARPPLKEG